VSFCGPDESCVEGECAPDPQGCVDDCLAAGRFCVGTTATVDCGQFDLDDCLDEGPVTACETGFTCFGGECREGDLPDAGPDVDTGEPDHTADGGCSCRAGGASRHQTVVTFFGLLLAGVLLRRRRKD